MVTEMIETMADQGVVGSLKMIFFSSLRHMEKQRDYPIKYVVALMCLCCFECLYGKIELSCYSSRFVKNRFCINKN